MWQPEHAATPVDAIVDDEEVVVAGELMFVYAVHAALLGSAAEAVAPWDKTCILKIFSMISWDRANDMTVLYSMQNVHEVSLGSPGSQCGVRACQMNESICERTYRFLALVTFHGVERIMILGDVKIEEMLVRKVFLTFGTPVHVSLLVVDVVCLE